MYKQTVDDLITLALAYDNTPETQSTFAPEQVAGFLDTEMRSAVVPMVVKLMEEFFVVASTSTVDSTNYRIKIAPDAAGFRLRDIYLIGDTNANTRVKAVRVNPDQLPYLAPGSGRNSGWWGGRGPTYIIENNEVVFYPALAQSYTAVVRYIKAPNHLLPYLTCTSQITAKDSTYPTITVANWATGTAADAGVSPWDNITGYNATTFDFMEQNSPYNFKLNTTTGLPTCGVTATATNSSTKQITVPQDVFDSLSVGDYVSTSGYFGLVQYLPFEAYNLLVLRASMRILKAQGDLQNLGVSAQLYNAAADDLAALLTPKVENAQAKVANYTSLVGRGGWNGPWSR